MSTEFLVSIKIWKALPSATFKVTTKASMWGWISCHASTSVKEITMFSLLDNLATCSHVDLVVHCYVPSQSYVVLPRFSRVTSGMPPIYSMDFMKKPVIISVGVARARIVGRSRSAKSSGVLSISGDQPIDVFL